MKIKTLLEKIKANKEFRLYLLWGIISTIINICLFKLLTMFGVRYHVANIISLVFVRIFCYLTNKYFVFHSKTQGILDLLKEIVSFFLARMATFLLDYFGLILLVEIVGLDSFISKLITSAVVIVCNYIFSKMFVFNKYKKTEQK